MSIYPEELGDPIVCDMTLPQTPVGPLMTPDFDGHMDLRAQFGVNFSSLTVASDEPTIDGTVRWIGAIRQHILARPEKYVLIDSVADIRRAKAAGKLAVNFHFQGSNGLLGDLNLVEVYRRLGVGHLLLAYNTKNLAGDGCHESSDGGLSNFGKALVEEMNRVGMVVDVTHTGYRTSMDAMEVSTQPVIFSHSNSKQVFDHQRNITDEQARACAKSGGVIGVNGVGLFLSQARFDASAETIARHADHFANLVGPQHVGFGLDSVHDIPYFLANFAKTNTSKYPTGGYLTSNNPSFAGPSIAPQVAAVLLKMGWSTHDVKGFLGENWLRVLEQVWR